MNDPAFGTPGLAGWLALVLPQAATSLKAGQAARPPTLTAKQRPASASLAGLAGKQALWAERLTAQGPPVNLQDKPPREIALGAPLPGPQISIVLVFLVDSDALPIAADGYDPKFWKLDVFNWNKWHYMTASSMSHRS